MLRYNNVINFIGECGARNIYLPIQETVNLTSPAYPMNYRDELNCQWLILIAEGAIPHILIAIIDFEMERGYDFVIIGEGEDPSDASTRIARLTGTIKLRRMTSQGAELWIQVVSDRTGTRRGFHFRIQHTYDITGLYILIVTRYVIIIIIRAIRPQPYPSVLY